MTAHKSYTQLQVEEAVNKESTRTNSALRRTRILASAVQECSEVGYKAATMAGIAQRAKVSTATLYREFHDKPALLIDCMAYLLPFLTHAITQNDLSENPVTRVTNLLIAHGRAIGDPFMTWLYRLYTGMPEAVLSNRLTLLARAGRDATQAFWQMQLSLIEEQGHIKPSCHFSTINLLLGQVERRTLLAQLLFGNDDLLAHPSLEAAAQFAAEGLFANLGTDGFHQSQWAKAYGQ